MPIKVNDVEINDEEVFSEMQYHTDVKNVEEAIFKSAQALVIRQLLLQEANTNNDSCSSEEDSINKLLSNNINIPPADNSSCKHYYKNNKSKFLDTKTNKILDFSLVHNHIKEYLQNQSTALAISEYIKMLSASANIKGFDFKDQSMLNIKIK